MKSPNDSPTHKIGRDDFWMPSPMVVKCLKHLDRVDNWKILKRERPEETEILSWHPFFRIFTFNLWLFVLILLGVLAAVDFGSGTTAGEFRTDLPVFIGVAAVIALPMAFYVANLYRSSWNRRARSLRQMSNDNTIDRPTA